MSKRTNLSKYRERKHKEHREKYALLERYDNHDIESMIGWESGRQSQRKFSKFVVRRGILYGMYTMRRAYKYIN